MARSYDSSDLVAALSGIAGGDGAAMKRLYEATARELFAICFAVVRNREATEDVLQEVYTKVWNRAAGYDPQKGTPMAWLSYIARNSAIDRVRARARRGHNVSDAALVLIADNAEPADEVLVHEQEADALRDKIDGLSEPEQSFIRDAFFRGLTYSEVAEQTGVPLGTVKTRIRRGLMTLRAQVTRD